MATVIVNTGKHLVSYEISRPGYVSVVRATEFDGAWYQEPGLEVAVDNGDNLADVAFRAYVENVTTPEHFQNRFASRADALAWVDGSFYNNLFNW